MKLLILLCAVGVAIAGLPEENQGISDTSLFEGDIIITPEQRKAAREGDITNVNVGRGATTGRLWSGKTVPYVISRNLGQYSQAVNAIRTAIAEWERKTCIRFVQRTNQQAYINFVYGRGCSSNVGSTGYKQDLNLDSGCWQHGIVVHEIGHALGFWHEQSRPDRDSYVNIYWNNILPASRYNFDKYNTGINSLNEPYDYGSIMHYGPTAFSTNGAYTILPKDTTKTIGQRRGLSAGDVRQMNKLYRCSASSCSDSHRSCAYWAGRGECRKSAEYMKANCKKSCKFC